MPSGTTDPLFRDAAPPVKEVDGGCVHADVGFEQLVPTVIVLVDRSGSMDDDFGGGESRWDALRRTLVDPTTGVLVQVANQARIGLTMYTSFDGNNGGACPVLVEVPPALDNFAAIKEKYDATEIVNKEDDTPTGESVLAVTNALKAVTEPGRKAIILATDGDPDTCVDADDHGDATKAASVARVREAFDAGITTSVISVGDDIGDQHLLDLARAGVGGGDATPYRALDAQALVDAFEKIIRGVVTCDFELSGTVQTGQESRGLVELDGTALVLGDPNGWQLTSPSRVSLLGEACRRVEGGAERLHIAFPCEVYEPIK